MGRRVGLQMGCLPRTTVVYIYIHISTHRYIYTYTAGKVASQMTNLRSPFKVKVSKSSKIKEKQWTVTNMAYAKTIKKVPKKKHDLLPNGTSSTAVSLRELGFQLTKKGEGRGLKGKGFEEQCGEKAV